MLTLSAIPEWQEAVQTLRTVISQKNRERDAVDINDPDSLDTHGKRALYLTGFVHGARFLLLDADTCKKEKDLLEKQIKDVELELKGKQNVTEA